MRAGALVNLEEFGKAEADFSAAIASGALSPEEEKRIRYHRAQAQFQRGDCASAIDDLADYLATETGESAAYFLAASCYVELGDRAAAVEHLNRALEVDPGAGAAQQLLASLQ